ncbi:hypothetical protein EON63_19040, partial [archaeon]
MLHHRNLYANFRGVDGVDDKITNLINHSGMLKVEDGKVKDNNSKPKPKPKPKAKPKPKPEPCEPSEA